VSESGVPSFDALRVAVVGDLVADHYVHAEPRRLSREAPVMVLRHRSESIGAGGAANVVRNLRALGSSVSVFGVVGRDASGRELLHKLEAEGVELTGVLREPGWITPTKTRIVAAEARRFPQQVLRIDREPEAPLAAAQRRAIADELARRADEFDALVISDYEYGLVGPELAAAAGRLARAGKTVVLDPRRHLEGFAGLTALTPNLGELAGFTGTSVEDLDELGKLRAAAQALRARVACRWLLVTRGNLGMALFGEGLSEEGLAVEASGQGQVTDVSGAGDTAASVFALALAAGAAPERAMQLANTASGIVVMENGTAVCSRLELERALGSSPAPLRLSQGSFR
jgi:rfaE bifunctional protein kinase chain/domain